MSVSSTESKCVPDIKSDKDDNSKNEMGAVHLGLEWARDF